MRRSSLAVIASALTGAALSVATDHGWLSRVGAGSSLLSSSALLSEAAANEINTALDPGVIRSRTVALEVARLPKPSATSRLAFQAPIPLDLFPGVFINALFDRFDPNGTGVTWVGHVEGVPGSSVTLVYGDQLMHGSVVMPSGTFQIRPAMEDVRTANRPAKGELHVISEVDQAALPREAEPLVPVLSQEAIEAVLEVAKTDSSDTIDVMVVYTPLAQQAVGGLAAMTNLINLGISETNTTYVNSDVKQRVRLVHTALVSYDEVSSFSTNLTSLRAGLILGVSALRDRHQADLVMMLVHPSRPDACGIAYVMTTITTAFGPFGYSVTDTSCVSPGLTVAHEWGHNMGAQHDWYVNASTLPHTYAHGYANPRPGQRWRTVMSYNDACATQGFSCTRLLAWANPDSRQNPLCTGGGFACRGNFWFLPGEGMGVPAGTRSNCVVGVLSASECDADDHRTLNDTAATVANFRQSGVSAASVRR